MYSKLRACEQRSAVAIRIWPDRTRPDQRQGQSAVTRTRTRDRNGDRDRDRIRPEPDQTRPGQDLSCYYTQSGKKPDYSTESDTATADSRQQPDQKPGTSDRKRKTAGGLGKRNSFPHRGLRCICIAATRSFHISDKKNPVGIKVF